MASQLDQTEVLALLARRIRGAADDRPLVRRIADVIRTLLKSEALGVGQRLPTQRQLATALDVYYLTVRRAYQALEAEGLVESVRGSGTFVADVPRSRLNALVLLPPWDEIVGDPHNSHLHSEFLAGMERACLEQQVALRVLSLSSDLSDLEIERWCRHVKAEHHGVLTTVAPLRPLIHRLADDGVPVVGYGRDYGHSSVHRVTFDRHCATFLATDYLIRLGCQRITLIARPATHPEAGASLAGYIEAHAHAGQRVAPKRIVRLEGIGSGPKHHYQRVIESALARGAIGDGIVTDVTGVVGLAVEVLEDHGVRVPQDVAAVGFDEFPDRHQQHPGLPCVTRPRYEMGRLAAERLVEAMLGRPLPEREDRVAPQLVHSPSPAHQRHATAVVPSSGSSVTGQDSER